MNTQFKKAADKRGVSVMVPTLADAFMIKMGVTNMNGTVLEISNLTERVDATEIENLTAVFDNPDTTTRDYYEQLGEQEEQQKVRCS